MVSLHCVSSVSWGAFHCLVLHICIVWRPLGVFSLYCVSLHCVLSGGQGVTVSGGSNAHNTCSRQWWWSNYIMLVMQLYYNIMSWIFTALFLAKIIKTRKAPARLYFQRSRSQLRGSIWRGPVCPLKAWVTASLSRPSVQEWNCDEWEKILLENWKEFEKQHRLELLYTSTTFQ